MPKLILASKSVSRAELLKNSCIPFISIPANIQESQIKDQCKKQNKTVEETTLILSDTKAKKISLLYPESLILAADQILEFNSQWFDKPLNLKEVKQRLKLLRGKSHRLVNGVVCFRGGQKVWSYNSNVKLWMRDFTDNFLDFYIKREGLLLLNSVGAYRIESLGAQLFTRISGDYYSILGLPILPLYTYLRKDGFLKT